LDYFIPVDLGITDKWEASEQRIVLCKTPFWIAADVVAAVQTALGWIIVPLGVAALTGILHRTRVVT
jgi:hypothetical protein